MKLNNGNTYRVINMKDNLYIYRCFFEEEKYIQLTVKQKYILTLIYALTDEDDYFIMKQVELAQLLGLDKQNVNATVSRLVKDELITRDNKGIKANRPLNRKSIPLHKDLVFGKYKGLSKGAKLYFSYFRSLQVKQNSSYLLIKGVDILNYMGVGIKSIQVYNKELEAVGLLKKGRKGNMNTLNFQDIR